MFYKKCVLRNFAKYKGKQLCQSLLFNKVAGLRPSNLLTEALGQVFSGEFCEILKSKFFIEHLWMTVSSLTNQKVVRNSYPEKYRKLFCQIKISPVKMFVAKPKIGCFSLRKLRRFVI